WFKRPRLLTSVHGEVESKDAFLVCRLLEHFGMAQGTDRVVIPSAPVLLHARARELIILRRPLIILGAVVEVDDIVDLSISYFSQQRGLRTAVELLRQLVKQIGHDAAKPLYAFE